MIRRYKGPAYAAGIAYTVSETIKNIQQTRAIVIPDSKNQTPPECTTQADPSTVGQIYSPPTNSTDLVSVARPFPYAKPETPVESDISLAEPHVFYPYPSYDPLKDHRPIDSPTEGADIDSNFNIFHSSPHIFDPSVDPSPLSPEFIQKSAEAVELGKSLLQWGLG